MKIHASKSTVTSSVSSATATSDTAPSAPLEIANIPSVSVEAVEAFVAAIDTFAQMLGSGFTVPQPEEVRRLAKPRKEAPTIVPMVADLSTRYDVVSAAFPTDVTLAKQQIVNTLSPVAERIVAVQKLVGAVMLVGQSGAWAASMVTYGLLKNEARGNALLRNALAPVREKLRPTYVTEEGGKTKVRGRSRKATATKAAEASAATPETPTSPPAPAKA
jgi:hypothetical protein